MLQVGMSLELSVRFLKEIVWSSRAKSEEVSITIIYKRYWCFAHAFAKQNDFRNIQIHKDKLISTHFLFISNSWQSNSFCLINNRNNCEMLCYYLSVCSCVFLIWRLISFFINEKKIITSLLSMICWSTEKFALQSSCNCFRFRA